MDSDKTENEKELTSTMGNVLSVTKKDEKSETSDATPTSSTDANTTSTTAQIVSDDPISSTSSDVIEQNKIKETPIASQSNLNKEKAISLKMDNSTIDHEADLLEISMSNVSNEKITEDVEDLVQDLENLLGESTDSFYISSRRTSANTSEPVKEKVSEAAETSNSLTKIEEEEKVQEISCEDPKVDKTLELNSTTTQPQPDEKVFENAGKDTVVDSTLAEPIEIKDTKDTNVVTEKIVKPPDLIEEDKHPIVPDTPAIDEQPMEVDVSPDQKSTTSNENCQETTTEKSIIDEQTPATESEIVAEAEIEDETKVVETESDKELVPTNTMSIVDEQISDNAPITHCNIEVKENVDEKIPEEAQDVTDNIQKNCTNADEPVIINSLEKCDEKTENSCDKVEVQEDINERRDEEPEIVKKDEEKTIENVSEVISEPIKVQENIEKEQMDAESIPQEQTLVNNEGNNSVELVRNIDTQEQTTNLEENLRPFETSVEKSSVENEIYNERNPQAEILENVEEDIKEAEENIKEEITNNCSNIGVKEDVQQTESLNEENITIHVEKIPEVTELSREIIPPTETLSDNMDMKQVSEMSPVSVEDISNKINEPIIEPEIVNNEVSELDEQNAENCTQIETVQAIVTPIREQIIPNQTKLDNYQGVEVEKAFGNDMPEDIVQHFEEPIIETSPENKEFYQEDENKPLIINNLSNYDETNVAIEVKELDPIQQAVASIMNVQDNQIEHEMKQEIRELRVEQPQTLVTPQPEEASIITHEQNQEVKLKNMNFNESDTNLNQPLTINIDDVEKEKPYSPKVTIKPLKVPDEDISTSSSVDNAELGKASLKMTITKQSDNTHSILKIYNPEEQEHIEETDQVIPKIIIKPIVQQSEQHSPKMKKQFNSPTSSAQRSLSPRITIKPVVKPVENKQDSIGPVKITIKPVVKTEDTTKKHSPKLTIKPIVKPPEDMTVEQVHSPRITIKPIPKPAELESEQTTPKLTIKSIRKPEESERNSEIEQPLQPKITIKPVVKPESDLHSNDEEEIKERIVLKINKGNLPTPSKDTKKREYPEDEKSEKLAKIKVKFSKEGGHPHIVQQTQEIGINKRSNEDSLTEKPKKQKLDEYNQSSTDGDDSKGTERGLLNVSSSPIVISEDSTQDSGSVILVEDTKDPLCDIPVYDITAESANKSQIAVNLPVLPPQPPIAVTPPTPRKRGRPRKVPLEVREEFKDIKDEPIKIEEVSPAVVPESGRPKRSCRGQNVRDTLGIKPRKPRGPGRGRGSKRGMGTRTVPMKPAKEPKLSKAKLKLLRDSFEDQTGFESKLNTIVIDVDEKPEPMVFASPLNEFKTDNKNDPSCSRISSIDTADIVMFEEETRMSADTNSRAQTPAKQVVSVEIEESQSSVQSTATTESGRTSRPNKTPRLEVHQEPEGAVISADQLAEYYWGGNGPFMLQEQVAQFLGINSFKRKYPGINRRMVDMQERDFIRESGLASEAMCDLGLTAVNSADILDIMYSDFQDKYEEYCKHQRDRQAKDLTNKQKALSLAASQEKTKLDITEQAIQSAAQWNLTFNKTRREQRKASMDLQTLTVHYPKGKTRAYNKPKIGNYPLALVPGQFTDYYQEYTPTEINNLPINTMCYDAIKVVHSEDTDESDDGSESDSDCSTSSSGSSDSSSGMEDCRLCKPTTIKRTSVART